jgi:hypothetical protein
MGDSKTIKIDTSNKYYVRQTFLRRLFYWFVLSSPFAMSDDWWRNYNFFHNITYEKDDENKFEI